MMTPLPNTPPPPPPQTLEAPKPSHPNPPSTRVPSPPPLSPPPSPPLEEEAKEKTGEDAISKEIDEFEIVPKTKTAEEIDKQIKDIFTRARVDDYETFKKWYMDNIAQEQLIIEAPRTWSESAAHTFQMIRSGRAPVEDMLFFAKIVKVASVGAAII